MAIRLIVGLGNPGAAYALTRHNAGFWWVDEIARIEKTSLSLTPKFHGFSTKIALLGQEIWLLKPQTYMNLSGRSVAALAQFYKILPEEILIAHDELDLPSGMVRLKFGGGHGGHNGLKSIIASIKTANFWRLRLGIGHPGDKNQVADFVLKAPDLIEKEEIMVASEQALTVLPSIIRGKLDEAVQELHTMNQRALR